MAAIEYGSDYWRVILNGSGTGTAAETIHLHADGMKIDAGTLIFTSAGRRPAGTEPNSNDKDDEKRKSHGGDKGKDDANDDGMIYFALAPGAWKVAYAANLKDGSPVSVEHWDTHQAAETVPPAGRAARV